MLKKGATIGEYKLLELVGSGGFADVWKAEKRTALDVNNFALKFFRPKDDGVDFKKVEKEIKVWKQLKGLPHIISVTELDQFDDYVYVVSDFAEEGSLEDYIKANNGKAKTINDAVKITAEILLGLENLHEKGFVHRDLKPDNILKMNGKHCLADFGISREMKSHSQATGTAGTFEYMPPEAFDKKPSISVETDIWAVGVILQQLLTGKLPYPQEDQPSLIAAILMSEPEKLSRDIPSNFKLVISKALDKKRENRFKSAKEMRKALKFSNEDISQEVINSEPNINKIKTISPISKSNEIFEEEKFDNTDSIHISANSADSYLNRDLLFEKIDNIDQSNADYQAEIIRQSQDLNTNPNLNDAIKKMQEKGIPEMKKYMDKVSSSDENEYIMGL